MIIENKTLDNGATIAIWEINETIDELLSVLNFNPFIVEQIYNFNSEKRKLEYLAVRALVYEICGESVSIGYKANGSPYLIGADQQISITHTGAYAAIILHPEKRVGIDIERPSDKVERVKTRFLSKEEISNIDPRSEKTHLTIHWAAKEALYKIMGIEIVEFNEQLYIEPFQPYLQGEIIAHETCSSEKVTYELEYQVYPQFVIVWTIK